MNNNQETITSSQQKVQLPEPNADNIAVLAHNLPNKPILPWNHFDSPVINKQVDKREQKLLTIFISSSVFLLIGVFAWFSYVKQFFFIPTLFFIASVLISIFSMLMKISSEIAKKNQ